MLVMIAGTMTMASAREGCIVTASRPIDTVGRPRPITPLMKPASRNTAAISIRKGSNMAATLTDRRDRHNLQITELAFGCDEGSGAAAMAMRFDLVDLLLFIAVADSRSITRGALAVHLAL